MASVDADAAIEALLGSSSMSLSKEMLDKLVELQDEQPEEAVAAPKKEIWFSDAAETDGLREIIAKVELAREDAKIRAERFGHAYKEPRWETYLTKKEILRLLRQKSAGFVAGIDMASQEEADKRQQRAERFGKIAPSARASALTGTEVNPRSFEGMAETVAQVRAYDDKRFTDDSFLVSGALDEEDPFSQGARRARAERFGQVPAEDQEAAEAAAEALLRLPGEAAGSKDIEVIRARWTEEQVQAGEALLGSGEERAEALHLCANGYIRAGDADILGFFDGYGAVFVGAFVCVARVCGWVRRSLGLQSGSTRRP
jgi:hypothetical protein